MIEMATFWSVVFIALCLGQKDFKSATVYGGIAIILIMLSIIKHIIKKTKKERKNDKI